MSNTASSVNMTTAVTVGLPLQTHQKNLLEKDYEIVLFFLNQSTAVICTSAKKSIVVWKGLGKHETISSRNNKTVSSRKIRAIVKINK